tara:strand:+ start:36 stop:467 length:432 start_codon:yes stop_codon:yes gene_type:complete
MTSSKIPEFIVERAREELPIPLGLRCYSYMDMEVILFCLSRICSGIEDESITINRDDMSDVDIDKVYRRTLRQANIWKEYFLRPWIKTKEMAELLDRDPKTLRDWIKQGYRPVGKQKIPLIYGVHYKKQPPGDRNFFWNVLEY